MYRRLLALATVSFLTGSTFAQELSEPQFSTLPDGNAELAPMHSTTPVAGSKALWDLQFSTDVTTAANGSVGQAAVAYFNDEFWTSMWSSDTLIRYTSSGVLISKLTISGVSGVRSITTDGTNLYMGNATNTIFVVDPVTQTLTSTITSAASVAARFVAYDPTLDAGAGGFWTGNFSTDIVAIDMSGAVLSTIPASTHGLTGMYGAAVDNVSSGGPYLWIFDQSGTNASQFRALQLPSGTPTVYTHDVFPDISTTHSLTSGLAGGAFFTTSFIPGESSLIGLVQSSPDNVIAVYDANIPASFTDGSINSLTSSKGYTQIPESQVFSETYEISYSNLGNTTIDTLFADISYFFNGSLVSSQNLFAEDLASGNSGTFTTTPVPMNNGIGDYSLKVSLYPNTTLNDSDDSNDTLSYDFQVTDSTFARDNNIPTGTPYNVSTTDSAFAVTLFELMATDTVTGIWIQLNAPVSGDSTFGVIFDFDGSMPTTEIARGTLHIISASQNAYYLEFENGVELTAGSYAFGCYEGMNTTIGLDQSDAIYTAGTNFFYNAGNWTASGIQTARFIRPVLGHLSESTNGIESPELTSFKLFPVPASNFVHVTFGEMTSESGTIVLTDMNGRVISSQAVTKGTTKVQLDMSRVQSGSYFVRIQLGNNISVRKLIVE